MKKLFLIVSILAMQLNIAGQKTDTTFYDSEWKEVPKLDQCEYYYIVSKDKNGKPSGKLQGYYKNGHIQFECNLVSVEPEVADGKATWYHQNGQRKEECIYKNGKAIGIRYYWDESGNFTNARYYNEGINIAQQIVDEKLYGFNPDKVDSSLIYFENLLKLKLNQDIETAFLFVDWGDFHYELKDYQQAINFYTVAARIVFKLNQPISLANIYTNIGYACYHGNQMEYAKKFFLMAMEIQEKELGKTSPEYIKSLENWQNVENKLNPKSDVPEWEIFLQQSIKEYKEGNYKQALDYALQTREAVKKVLGKEDPFYAISLNNLALIYNNLGDYSKTEHLYLESLEIIKKIFGEDQNYAGILNNLALLYSKMGNYQKSESLYLKSIEIYKNTVSEMDPNYAASLNNLASLYKEMGETQKVEALYLKASEIYKTNFGESDHNYATTLFNLAGFYNSLGNYQKAESLYLKSSEINKTILGESNINYAHTLLGIAQLYSYYYQYAKTIEERGKYFDKTFSLYSKVLDIYKTVLGENHPDYAEILNSFASLLESRGSFLYEDAKILYEQALGILANTLGENHTDYATILNNLASLYEKLGDYKQAEKLYLRALEIHKASFGQNNKHYGSSLNNLASMYYSTENYAKAYSIYDKANDNLNYQINHTFTFLTDDEKDKFLKTIKHNFSIYNSFALNYKKQKPDIPGLCYNNELSHKGMILQNSKAVQAAIMSSNIPELTSIYNDLISTKKMLGYQYSKSIAKRTLNTDSLEQLANNLEKRLLLEMQKYPGLNKYAGFNRQVSWTEVQKALKPGEAAIEFISFQYRSPEKWTDSILYCALVLRKEFKYPKMIFLFEEKQLQELLPSNTGSSGSIDYLYNLNGSFDAGKDGYLLYKILWQPVDSILKGIKTVYFAPSGLLHKISFNAIALPDKMFLSDKYNLQNISSTSVLINKKEAFKTGQQTKVQVYGGITYSLSINDLLNNAKKFKKDKELDIDAYRPVFVSATTRGELWSYLPGTLDEAKNIYDLFSVAKMNVNFLSGNEANEESFKMMNGKNSPTIIHIATHGFFMSDPKTDYSDLDIRGISSFKVSDNPLFRSGLMLAGSNAAWNNDSIPAGIEDGILTANEISQMFLPNTRLVVLSACETGLGEIKGSEGVFGLQRSFKMAGVDCIIMSLWQVPDQQTSELMQEFYKQLLSGQTVRDAFTNAQNQLKETYKDSPFSWAAFVLIE